MSLRQMISNGRISTFSLLIVFLVCQRVNGICQADWTEWNQICYRVYTDKKGWQESQTECVREGGSLASIHNQSEMEFISSLHVNIKIAGLKEDQVWIGLNDIADEGNFQWIDKAPLVYSNWYTTITNGVASNCVMMVPKLNYTWVIGGCTNWNAYICNIPTLDLVALQEKYTRKQLYTSIQNKALVNHIMAIRRVSSILQCSALCLREATCQSFNYGSTPLSQDEMCYLNSATDKQFPGDLVEKDGFVFALPIK